MLFISSHKRFCISGGGNFEKWLIFGIRQIIYERQG